MPAGFLLIPFSRFFFLGGKGGWLFGFFIAALDLRHDRDSPPELGAHGDDESGR